MSLYGANCSPELRKYPFDFSSVSGYIEESPPVVGLHGKVSECVEAENGAPTVADQNVENPVVPPTLAEIR